MFYGNVYVFNLYSTPVSQFDLNEEGSAGAIGAPVKSSTPPYEPPQLVVARTNLNKDQLDGPLFVQGDNTIKVNYGGQNWVGTVTIPTPTPGQSGGPRLEDDLWLYLAFGQAFLFTAVDGTMIAPVTMALKS